MQQGFEQKDEVATGTPLFRGLTVLAVLIVAGMQFSFLSWHSLWNNEFITLAVLDYDYGHLIAERIGRNHMPLYFVFLKAWTEVVGRGPLALHLPSAALGFCGIIALWRLAVYLFGERMGLFVLLVTGLNEIHLHMATDARRYSWLFLSMVLAMTGLIRYLEDGRRRWLALLVGAGLFGMAVQLLFVFLIGIFAAYLIARRRDFAERWKPALVCTLLPLLLTTPLVYWWMQVQDKVGGGGKLEAPAIDAALRQTANIFLGDKDYIDPIAWLHRLLAGTGLLLAINTWWGLRKGRGAEGSVVAGPTVYRGYVGLWLLMWLVPLLAMALVGMQSRENSVNNWRYYLVLAPAAPLLLATGLRNLQARGRGRIAAGLGAAMIGVCIAASVAYLFSPEEGVREAAAYLKTHRQPGDEVLVGLKKARSEGFVYYGALERAPAQLIPENHDPVRLMDWIVRKTEGAKRIWAVYYTKPRKKLKNELHEALRKHPEYFKRVEEETFSYGDATLHLYEILPAFEALNSSGAALSEESSPAGEDEPEED